MASASTLSRLHRAEQNAQFVQLPPVKSKNFSDLQIDVSASAPAPVERLSRFVIGRRDEATIEYQSDSTEIMSIVQPADALDSSGAFRQIAGREKLMQFVAARVDRAANRVPVY